MSNIPDRVPLLPGHQFTDPFKVNHYKTQQFEVKQGEMTEKTNYIQEQVTNGLMKQLRASTPKSMQYGNIPEPQNDYVPRIQPKWLKFDRKVLNFNGYFKESVVENPNENFRIRKMIIYYYLNDGTIYIMEPRIENSGLPQGVFSSRQMLSKKVGTDDWYTWEDFNVGINLNFNEHIFRIVSCDQFTKDFFKDHGIELNPEEPMPDSPFDVKKKLTNMKIPPPDFKEYKEYCEVKLGGGHPNDGLAQYLANDRKVLSFDIMWQDMSLEGDVNFYTLSYFLSDGTVDVKEVRAINNGKDNFPVFIKRAKLPKVPILTHYPGMSLKKEEHYGPQDFICGNKITIFSRDCLIYNCDPYTKNWYKNHLQVDQVPVKLQEQQQQRYEHKVPPYNGYGTPEDSLGSVYSLDPKPPRKDVNKMFAQDQYILRFNCRLVSEIKDFNDRTFILSFYCGDDTVQVYETSPRNSGIMPGKFLERQRYNNPITGKQYRESDMQIGTTVSIGTWSFQIIRADKYTYKYMQRKPDSFPQAVLGNVLGKLVQCSKQSESAEVFMVSLLKHLDKNDEGCIEFQQLAEGFRSMGLPVTHQESYTLMRSFDKHDDFKLSVEDLYNALAQAFNKQG